jgi:drug/metabolite transporter (DMT)-like permease
MATGAWLSVFAMTAILVLILVVALFWRLGLNGLLRWTGILAAGLGLMVVLGVDAGQGIPLAIAGALVWAIGRAIQPVAPRPYAL